MYNTLKWVLIAAGLFSLSGLVHPGIASLLMGIAFFVGIAVITARRFAEPVQQTPSFLPPRTVRNLSGGRVQPGPTPPKFQMLSPIRSLLSRLHPKAYPYFRGVFGFVIATGVVYALRAGVTPQTGTMATLNKLVPTLVLATMVAAVLVPIIKTVAAVLSGFGIKRGWLDILVGVILTSVYWLPGLASDFQTGGPALAMAIGHAFAGAFAGFEFWRAEGYPGARQTLKQWLNGLRNGFLQGLGR